MLGKKFVDQTAVNVSKEMKNSGFVSAPLSTIKIYVKSHCAKIGLVVDDQDIENIAALVKLEKVEPIITKTEKKKRKLREIVEELEESFGEMYNQYENMYEEQDIISEIESFVDYGKDVIKCLEELGEEVAAPAKVRLGVIKEQGDDLKEHIKQVLKSIEELAREIDETVEEYI